MTEKPYFALAFVYDLATDADEYKKWADYVVGIVKSVQSGKRGLDLGCGTGYFTRALFKAGFLTEGVDSSPEMLDIAVKNARKDGMNILFRVADMTDVKVFNRVDFITVINDGINYIPQNKLDKTFRHFYSLLNYGGALIFDISTEYKLRNIIGNNLFAEDTEDFTYLWFNRLSQDKVDMDISVFLREDDRFIKREEAQTEYIHTVESVIESLKKCGYKSITAENHLGGALKDDSVRVQFTAKKLK